MRRVLIAGVLVLGVATSSSWGQEKAVTPEATPEAPPGMALIPGGEFQMGSDVVVDEEPVHTVRVGPFYLDTHEVTNARYLAFCQATGHRLPAYWGNAEFRSGPEFPDHPVVFVSWFDAQAYSQWAGKRLPTEAEWEFAARGGLTGAAFPTGEEIDEKQARYASEGPVEVGSYEPNGYGLFDMAGNVWEWVADYYHPDYYSASPADSPRGPERGNLCVIRGGGWHGGRMCVRVSGRAGLRPGWLDFAVGFRCAMDVEGK